MSEIQQGRYDQLLRRVADLKGPGSKVNDALTELFPVIDLERVPAELLFLGGWRIGMASTSLPAQAASTPKIQLVNPAGSGSLVVVTRVDVQVLVTQQIEMTVSNAIVGFNVGGAVWRDTRSGNARPAMAQLHARNDAVGIIPSWVVRVLGSTNHPITDENGVAVLAPGTALTVGTAVVNQAVFVSFLWRERVAEPSELNF